jgi:ribosomal protein S12 methylthiotransferase
MSMGCAKNSVDSERLAGLLSAAGNKIVSNASEAQVGLINTCAFIQEAVKENIDAILDLEDLKKQGKLEKIIVAGCIVNRYEAELRKELPLVDFWAGTEDWDKIVDFLGREKGSSNCLPGPSRGLLAETRPWSRYLKVGEGCDTYCSYCTIPLIRGRLRSVPILRLVEEAKELVASGAKELCLVGQDLTAYGRDLYGEPSIQKLLEALENALPSEMWIRLLYLHPDRITRDFLDFLSDSDKVLPYLDIPIQHIDSSILAAMNRSPDVAHIRNVFQSARRRNPLFTLRTTIMVGFPGETEAQFERVLEFLEEAEIDRVGAFMYSPEEGTKAALMAGQVPDEVKEERYSRLMGAQSQIAQERGELFVGKTLRVLVEETDQGNASAYGRSYRDAPEVDGVVFLENGGSLVPGSWVDASIQAAMGHDLFAFLPNQSPAPLGHPFLGLS